MVDGECSWIFKRKGVTQCCFEEKEKCVRVKRNRERPRCVGAERGVSFEFGIIFLGSKVDKSSLIVEEFFRDRKAVKRGILKYNKCKVIENLLAMEMMNRNCIAQSVLGDFVFDMELPGLGGRMMYGQVYDK
jgi:hypothetical protein